MKRKIQSLENKKARLEDDVKKELSNAVGKFERAFRLDNLSNSILNEFSIKYKRDMITVATQDSQFNILLRGGIWFVDFAWSKDSCGTGFRSFDYTLSECFNNLNADLLLLDKFLRASVEEKLKMIE